MKAVAALILIFLVCCLAPCDSWARSVTDWRNKHNLSIYGPGLPGITRAAEGEERVCIFCHTPHHANTSSLNQTPLWSRELSSKTYDLYASSTLQSNPQQPTGSARLCLSCHDGTIALGRIAGGKIIGGLSSPIPVGRASNLGENPDQPDLRNDHPISITYPQDNPEISTSPADIRLESGILQCTACHDPHDDQNSYFLVKNNKLPGSPLCVTCHNKSGWQNSLHRSLDIIYPPIPPKKPWPEEVYACEACHMPHNAQQPLNLLRGQTESLTCLLACHNGSLPVSQYGKAPINYGFNQMYKHSAATTGVVHWADEDTHDHMNSSLYPLSTHVECVDCHDPHKVNSATAIAPAANGYVKGVKDNKLATHDFHTSETEYDVCFKCHADSYAKFRSSPEILPIRQLVDKYNNLNQYNRFVSTNPSFHPVMDQVISQNVNLNGLKSTYFARDGEGVPLNGDGSSKIYCTACHDPHGSMEPHMLLARYVGVQDLAPPTSYFSGDYALCYRCHDESKLLDGASSWFPSHNTHVRNMVIPCYVCHDPHGGESVVHLINFDVSPSNLYHLNPLVTLPVYTATSTGGSCTVDCHKNGTGAGNHTQSYSHLPK